MLKAILEMPQKVFRYITSAAARIFSPSDDDYPATGVQPFEGEPNKEDKVTD
jgi:nucleoid-associated protein YgaU